MDLYRKIWVYSSKYLRLIVFAVFCTLIVSAMSGLTAWMIKPVLDDIFVKKDSALLSILPLAVVAIYATKGIFTYLQSYVIRYVSLNVIRDVRDDLYGHILYLPLKAYNDTNTGKLISNVINDVGQLNRLMADVVKDVLQQSFTIVGLLVVLFYRDWKLAFISVVVFPFAGAFISRYGRKMRKISRKSQESVAGIVNTLQESFTGSRIVKAFTMEDGERFKFAAENQEFTRLSIRAAKVSSVVSPAMETLGGVAVAGIIFYGGGKVISSSMTPGDFFSFTTALIMLYNPVKSLANLHNITQQAMASAERVFGMFDMDTEKHIMDTGTATLDGMRESIEYRDVGFGYSREEADVLKGVNLTVKKGEVVALVGSSGGGKTTLVNLLPRFYDVTSGSILIDGRDTRDFSLRALRGFVSVVTQDTILFNDTIRNNIAYGKDSFTEEQIKGAAAAAHADGFIDKLPQGYDTVIGEKGVRLSGGQKQRISIARAILKDSPILVLDEATSALDTESERIVQKALENLMKNRTTLVIAHRLSTVINADKIVVIHGGRIADIGRHDELIAKSPIYKKLYEMQFGQAEKEYVDVR